MNTVARKVLITGATSGIGEALARRLAKEGAALLLTGRNEEKLRALESELGARTFTADLSDRKQRGALAAWIEEECPDLLINCAGHGRYGELLDLGLASQLDIIEVNSIALFELTVAAARSLRAKGKKGVIMNVSSVAALLTLPGMATYGASKAFVNSFTQSLDLELRSSGIRVLASCPGMVATEFRSRASEGVQIQQTSWLVMSADYAAGQILHQIEKGRGVLVFDWKYRLASFIARHLLPSKVLKKILYSNYNLSN